MKANFLRDSLDFCKLFCGFVFWRYLEYIVYTQGCTRNSLFTAGHTLKFLIVCIFIKSKSKALFQLLLFSISH